MSAPPYMPLYVADYLADTGHLTALEHGAYLMILMSMWRIGPLPHDPTKLAKFARCSPRQWASVSATIMPMMTIENGLVSNRRLMAERAKYADYVNRQRKAGEASAAAKALKNNNLDSTSVQPKVNQPEPEPERKKEVAIAPSVRERKPSKRCPNDWQPAAATIAKLEGEGLGQILSTEIEKFRDYTFASSKTDWDATFRNWIRNASPSHGGGRSKNWRELEIENNRNALAGASLALEMIENERRSPDLRSANIDPERSEGPFLDGPRPALPQAGAFAGRTGNLVEGLSRRLRAV